MTVSGRDSERGASLVMALAFVSLLGVFSSVLLGYAATGQRATVAVREQRRAVYASDGSVQTAIEWARRDAAIGRDPAVGGPCPDFEVPDLDGEAVTVQCTGGAGSGAVAAGVNAPANGLLTLARGGEPGLTTTGTGQLRVTGAIFSNSGLSIGAGGRIEAVDAPATARGTCSAGSVVGSPTRCSIGGIADSTGDDPNYPASIAALPEHREVPACATPGSDVKLEPGFYDDARGLTDLTSDACPGSTLVLAPGDYYFDFDLDTARSPIWRIDDAKARVVGGCDDGASATPSGGVHLEFGGASRVVVDAGIFEVCAPPTTSGQQIALYGRPRGDQPKAAFAFPTAGVVENGADSVPFGSPEAARTIGETPEAQLADAILPPGKPDSRAALDFRKLEPMEPPPGAAAVTATLLVGHQELASGAVVTSRPGSYDGPPPAPRDPDAPKLATPKKVEPPPSGPGGGVISAVPGAKGDLPSGSFTVTVTVQPGDGSKACVWNIPAATEPSVEQLSVTPCADTPEKRDGLTLRYEVVAASTIAVTEHLDGVQLMLGYTLPAVRAQDGCTVVVGGCAFVSGTPGARILVHGTVYAPLASVQVSAGGADAVLFDRGVVVRSMRLADLPATDTHGLIRLGAKRTVLFTGSSAGEADLQASVSFGDSPVPGATARVLWWRPGG